jgi:hypothetical protein
MIGAERPSAVCRPDRPSTIIFFGLGEAKQKPRGVSIRRIFQQSHRTI